MALHDVQMNYYDYVSQQIMVLLFHTERCHITYNTLNSIIISKCVSMIINNLCACFHVTDINYDCIL